MQQRDAQPTPAASALASRLTSMMRAHRHVVAILPYGNHVEIVWWTRKAGRPPPPPSTVRDGVHVHYAETPGPIVDIGARAVGQMGDDTRRAMNDTPGYWMVWYTLKSLALVGVTALLFFVLGKNKGARGKLFGYALGEVMRRVNTR